MSIQQRQELKQTQQLVMTPQLQQAIKLLQMTAVELTDYLATEVETNPLLEVEKPEGEESTAEITETTPASAGDEETPLDYDPSESFGGDSYQSPYQVRNHTDDDEEHFDRGFLQALSLRDHLEVQLRLEIPDARDQLIGSYLIDSLDDDGYFRADIAAIAKLLGADLAKVETVFKRLQGFDPAGVFARSIPECLALQLQAKGALTPAMQALCSNLELVARKDLPNLAKACGVPLANVAGLIAELKTLNPKPGHDFVQEPAVTVIPDLLLRKNKNGAYTVELNNEALPRVLINNHYHAQISKTAKSKQDVEFISQCHQRASWLVKALHQRATNVLKVASEIVRHQEDFFERGINYLKPLTLKDIAVAIGVHESTVSRVTTNKYIATPRGLFLLKYFFSNGINSSYAQDGIAAEALRNRIKAMIAAEKADGVLSDEDIAGLLKAQGIDIARRTIAKYRESLGIPTSSQRRRSISLTN